MLTATHCLPPRGLRMLRRTAPPGPARLRRQARQGGRPVALTRAGSPCL